MEFVDIHIHALPNVDDGAKTVDDLKKMIDASYRSGTRKICFTPHYHPGFFGFNKDKIPGMYKIAQRYVSQTYPDMKYFLGNELRYSPQSIDWLSNGDCKTMNGTRYVLVDFSEKEETNVIENGLYALLGSGWTPILAHAERYVKLHGNVDMFLKFREDGIILQADTQSLFNGFGPKIKHQCKKMLSARLIDVISSDAHNVTTRPPEMDKCFEYVCKKYGQEYARYLFNLNASNILDGLPIDN